MRLTEGHQSFLRGFLASARSGVESGKTAAPHRYDKSVGILEKDYPVRITSSRVFEWMVRWCDWLIYQAVDGRFWAGGSWFVNTSGLEREIRRDVQRDAYGPADTVFLE